MRMTIKSAPGEDELLSRYLGRILGIPFRADQSEALRSARELIGGGANPLFALARTATKETVAAEFGN